MEKHKDIAKRYNEKYALMNCIFLENMLKDGIIYETLLNLGAHNGLLLEVGCRLGHTSKKLLKFVRVVRIGYLKKLLRFSSKTSYAYFIRAGCRSFHCR